MGEFRRSRSKVWWSNYPEDEDDEMTSSPPLLPGWGPGVSMTSDRGSPSNGSHKSQDSGFSDSEGSSPNTKRTDKQKEDELLDNEEDNHSEDRNRDLVHPGLLSPDTPVARIPRVCLSRCRTKTEQVRTLVVGSTYQCYSTNLNKTWAPSSSNAFTSIDNITYCCQRVNRSVECVLTESVADSKPVNEPNQESEETNCHKEHEVSSAINEEKVPKESDRLDTSDELNNGGGNDDKRSESRSAGQPSSDSLDSSVSVEEETARFIGDPETAPPSSPSPPRPCPNDAESSVTTLEDSLEITGPPGPPVHCSTPKTTKLFRLQPRSQRVTRRPLKILRNFESTREKPVEKDPPVDRWLYELRTLYEPECMTTLQSKSLTADLNKQVTVMAAITTEAVRSLQQRTKLISTEFTKLYRNMFREILFSHLQPSGEQDLPKHVPKGKKYILRQVECSQLEHVGPLVQSLVGHIIEFLTATKENSRESKELLKACDHMKVSAGKQQLEQTELEQQVTALGKAFTHLVDELLVKQIKMLITVLEEPSSNLVLLSALSSLTGLGLEGTHLGQLMARCSGVRALLGLCIDSQCVSVRTAALRTLATVCCSSQTIRQFEQAGGVEILAEIMADEKRSETELTEAVSVLTQITAPWIEDNHIVQGLTQHLTCLVTALTRMVSNTTSSCTLLLCAAALCHLSLLEPQCVWPLLECCTAGTLLLAVRRQGPHASVFLQEQAAGLLANMAAVPEARPHLAEHRAVVALLCFLQVRHSPLQRAPEIAAAERLQHKSAIALSRMCSDQAVASQVVELQGVCRLVRLCKEERERNHSDGVLVACLAALRKIAANCGTKVIEELNARELVEPRLLDSFLIYSSRQESYV